MKVENKFTTEAERKTEAESAQKEALYYMVPLTIVLAVWDGWYFYLFLEHEISLRSWFIFKSIVVGFLLIFTLALVWRGKDVRQPAFLTVFSLALGPFGSILFILLLLFYFTYSLRANVFSEWLENLFPTSDDNPVLLLYERLLQRWDDLSSKAETIPYRDIMALGTTEQKQAALAKIGKDFRPELAAVLMEALNDKTNAIRVQVATTLAKLDGNFTNKINQLEIQHQKIPNDIEVIEEIARLCFERASSGLLEKIKATQLLEMSYDYYGRLLHFKPEDRVKGLIANTLLHMGKTEDAKEILKDLIDSEDAHLRPLFVQSFLRALFDMREYAALHDFCIQFSDLDADENAQNYVLMEYIRLWRSDARPEAYA